MTEGPREFALVCPSCGEENPPEFRVCWSCHAKLPEQAEPAPPPPEPRAPEPRATPSALTAERRKRLTLELAVVLFVLWLPGVVGGIWNAIDPVPPTDAAPTDAAFQLWLLLEEAGILALLFYLAWLDGDWRRRLGLSRPRALRDGLVVLGVFAAFELSIVPALMLGEFFGLEESSAPLRSPPDAPWIVSMRFLVSAGVEETLFRAYLWSRFTELTRRPVLSIAICALLFAVAHGYPLVSTIQLFIGACFLGVIFWRVRSLWGLVLGHWLYNVWLNFG